MQSCPSSVPPGVLLQPDDRLFELFSAEQLLKDKDLTTADVETGNIGQSLDGQIDSFYLFADGIVIDDVA